MLFLMLGGLNIPEDCIDTLRNGYVQLKEKSLSDLSKELFKNWMGILFGINKLENHPLFVPAKGE